MHNSAEMKKTLHCNLLASALFLLITFQPCLASLAADEASLLSLKARITLDPHRILATNWTNSSSVCNWIGVTCGRHHRVTALNISNMELSGSIPPQLGNLSFLVSLDLSHNFLSGVLPHGLFLLHRLKYFSISSNNFTGKIPEEMGNLYNLEFLGMQFNQFWGSIPSGIFNISTLKSIGLTSNKLISGQLPIDMCTNFPLVEGIHLSDSQLSGQIPSNLSQCSRLQILSLSYNSFSGQIPAALGSLKSLQYLYVGGNSLTGMIPHEIGNLQYLVEFGVESNHISGTLPFSIFNISSLKILLAYSKKLTGYLPKYIGNLTMLKDLMLSENKLTGVLPREIGQLYQLEDLALGDNFFTDSIPVDLFNISTLEVIDVGDNNLSGTLPTNLCHGLPSLQELYLHTNSLSGAIPISLSYCMHLKILALGSNKFTGIFPRFLANLTLLEILQLSDNNLRTESFASELSFITSFTNCRFLRILGVHDNPLDGIIPTSVGNLSSLQYFYAYNCRIRGSIPAEIGNLSSLVLLSLYSNELSGNIPHTLGYLHNLQELFLDHNSLEGPIVEGLCHLQSLGHVELSQNQLSGPIPKCIGNIASLRKIYLDSNMLTSIIPSNLWNLKDLLNLNLSSNSLSGFLPLEMGNLVAAVEIDLSMNQLSGFIPTTIGKLQNLNNLSLAHNKFEGSIPVSMGSMISLVTLDLSYNNLSGSIPKTMEALQYLKSFNVSFNALTGEIPTGGPFQNFTLDSFKANKALCGIPRFDIPLCRTKSNRRPTRKKVQVALFICAGVVALITIVSFGLILSRYKRKDNITSEADVLVSTIPERISYYEILQATEQFNEGNLLGIGGFGTVYKGILQNGQTCAVKVFNLQSGDAFKSFDVECEVLRNIRHRNLTKVISSCSNEDFRALVLEYMPKGNLEKWLYSHNYCLDFMQRLNIMIEVASALEYLHHGYSTPIVHCDLKPSNVLLDEEMIGHVSDFGIAKLLGDGESIVLTNTIATLGYIAPEYGLEGLVSTRCDVYSYGVLLMETFTRKRPNDNMFAGDLSLKSWVERSVPESSHEVVDENLAINLEENQIDKILQYVSSILVLALKCTTKSPGDRINMKVALAELQKIKSQFPQRGK